MIKYYIQPVAICVVGMLCAVGIMYLSPSAAMQGLAWVTVMTLSYMLGRTVAEYQIHRDRLR